MNNEWQERENQHRDAMLEAAHKWDNRTEYEWNEKRQAYIMKECPEMQAKDYCLLAVLIVIVIILALLPPM